MTPSPDDWIVIPNWDKFQHYKDRDPTWIKLYLELLHKDEWLALTDGARGLQVRIWLLFAASGGTCTLRQVQAQGWSRHSAGHLRSLVQAGFVELSASRPLAQRREEKDKEKKPPYPLPEKGGTDLQDLDKALTPRAAGVAILAGALNSKTNCSHTRCRGADKCIYE